MGGLSGEGAGDDAVFLAFHGVYGRERYIQGDAVGAVCDERRLYAFDALVLRPGEGGGGLVDRQEGGEDEEDHAEEAGDGGGEPGGFEVPESGCGPALCGGGGVLRGGCLCGLGGAGGGGVRGGGVGVAGHVRCRLRHAHNSTHRAAILEHVTGGRTM